MSSKVNSSGHKNEKKVNKFYALLVDKDSKKRIQKLSFNIEISIPNNTELILLNQDEASDSKNKKRQRNGEEKNMDE